jgi:hypothetical protein
VASADLPPLSEEERQRCREAARLVLKGAMEWWPHRAKGYGRMIFRALVMTWAELHHRGKQQESPPAGRPTAAPLSPSCPRPAVRVDATH